MRILHVVEAAEGGISLHINTLARAQKAAGHAVAVALPPSRTHGRLDSALAPALREHGIDVEVVPFVSVPIHPRNVLAARQLRRFIANWSPTVVHSHSTTAGAIARPLTRACGLPTVHTPNGLHFAAEPMKLAGLGAVALERLMDMFTDKVIAVSPSEAIVLERVHHPSKIEIVPNAFPATDEAEPPLPERPRVVCVARLVRQKHPELAVDVLARTRARRPDVDAVLVGHGPLEKRVRTLIDRLDPAIQLVTSGDAGIAWIGRSSVVLLSSRWEGAPYVPLEAMALRRPIVATDVVGSRDVVEDGVTGYTFPPSRPDLGAQRIVTLIDDPSLAARLGAQGFDRLREKYALEDMVEAIDRIYNEVAGSRRRTVKRRRKNGRRR